MSDNKSNLKNAIMDLAREIDAVFKKYNKNTRKKAWERITSSAGEKEVSRILEDPKRQISPFMKLALAKESKEA